MVEFTHTIVGLLGLFVLVLEAKLRGSMQHLALVSETIGTASFVTNSCIRTAIAVREKMSDDRASLKIANTNAVNID